MIFDLLNSNLLQTHHMHRLNHHHYQVHYLYLVILYVNLNINIYLIFRHLIHIVRLNSYNRYYRDFRGLLYHLGDIISNWIYVCLLSKVMWGDLLLYLIYRGCCRFLGVICFWFCIICNKSILVYIHIIVIFQLNYKLNIYYIFS